MELRRKGKHPLCLQSRAAFAALLILCPFVLGIFGPTSAIAQEKDGVLPESGIHYPEGFDPNTVGNIRGKVYDYNNVRPESGPVHFRLVSDKETYIVLGSPAWYWNDSGIRFADGMEVQVRGSKALGKDGRLYIIAQEIQVPSTGQTVALRDEDGYPRWRAGSLGPGGAGFRSPQRGMGSGPGGRSRGGRR